MHLFQLTHLHRPAMCNAPHAVSGQNQVLEREVSAVERHAEVFPYLPLCVASLIVSLSARPIVVRSLAVPLLAASRRDVSRYDVSRCDVGWPDVGRRDVSRRDVSWCDASRAARFGPFRRRRSAVSAGLLDDLAVLVELVDFDDGRVAPPRVAVVARLPPSRPIALAPSSRSLPHARLPVAHDDRCCRVAVVRRSRSPCHDEAVRRDDMARRWSSRYVSAVSTERTVAPSSLPSALTRLECATGVGFPTAPTLPHLPTPTPRSHSRAARVLTSRRARPPGVNRRRSLNTDGRMCNGIKQNILLYLCMRRLD